MNNTPGISLVIPARNEAARLPATLQAVLAYFAKTGADWEIIVVDNNSTDDTPRLVEQFAATEPRLRLLTESRPGKGAALKCGMTAARKDLVIFSDSDLSCPIEEEAKLRNALLSGYDVAVASRRLPGSEVEKSAKRRLMSALFNWIVQALALPGIRDSQCGFKGFTREAAHKLFGASRVAGWAFDVEILFLARRAGLQISEVPVRWKQAQGSRINALRDALEMVRDIIRFRRAYARGAYKEMLESKP